MNTKGATHMIGAKCNLKDRFAKKFLTIRGEEVIYATRQDLTRLIPSVVISVCMLGGVMLLASFSSVIAPVYFLSFLLLALIISTLVIEIFLKQVVEWFFHFYIITNHKIVEVSYRPMFSRVINEVLVDQVRCTEVDVQMSGILSEMTNVGNVLLTFDRPTHEQVFSLEFVKNPRIVATHLADTFGMQPEEDDVEAGWYKDAAMNKLVYRPGKRVAAGGFS